MRTETIILHAEIDKTIYIASTSILYEMCQHIKRYANDWDGSLHCVLK